MQVLLAILVSIIPASVFAQSYCATEEPLLPIATNSSFTSTSIISIPIIFHLIRPYGEEVFPINQTTLESQVDSLNSAFSGSVFQFYMAGYTRTTSSTWINIAPSSTFLEDMTSELAIDPKHAINVYVGQVTYSFATFPWDWSETSTNNGIFLDYTSLPGGSMEDYGEGNWGIHEMGHYLGLYHTWQATDDGQGGCTTADGGDLVDDTPYARNPTSGCPSLKNTCPNLSGNDPIHNYMDYSCDTCRTHFTPDQFDRMNAVTGQYRPNLGGSNLELLTGLSIPSSRSLKFLAVNVKVGSFYGIDVYGRLDASDTVFDAVTNAWSGMYYHDGSLGTLDNVDILIPFSSSDAVALTVDDASITVMNSVIEVAGSSQIAVVVSGSSASPVFANNKTIKASASEAVYVTNSASPYFYGNYITKSSPNGVLFYSGMSATPMFQSTSGGKGLNEFEGGGTGIRAWNHSIVYAGESSSVTNDNHFCSQTGWHLSATESSTIYASYNYFTPTGSPSVNQGSGSAVYTSPTRSGSASCSANKTGGNSLRTFAGSYTIDGDLVALFLKGKRHATAGEVLAAERIWELIIMKHGDSPVARSALVELGHLFIDSGRQSILSFISSVASGATNLHAYAKEVLSKSLLVNGDYSAARTSANEGIAASRMSGRLFEAYMALFFIELDAGHFAAARNIVQEMTSKDDDQKRALKVMQMLAHRSPAGESVPESDPLGGRRGTTNKSNGDTTTELHLEAFPNPFNPTVTLQYTLRTERYIDLNIFDTLGRPVQRIERGLRSAGTHEIVFDAKDLPSGTYIYRISAGSETRTGTLLLLK